MKYFLGTAVLTLTFSSAASAQGCNHGLSNLAKPFVESAIRMRTAHNYQGAIRKLKSTPANTKPSFCILYEIGRNLLNLERYDEALTSLQSAASIAGPDDRAKQAIFNIIGYTCLEKKDYGQAVLALERQLIDDQFANLSTDKKTKVFNSTGFAYLRLNQYAPAQLNFEKALANGSKLAQANLAIVESLIAYNPKAMQIS